MNIKNGRLDLIIYNEEKSEILYSKEGLNGANETILGEYLENGTYFIAVTYEELGLTIDGEYLLRIGILAISSVRKLSLSPA